MYVHNLYVRKQPSSYFLMIVLALFKLCQWHIPLHFLSGFTYIFETINIFLMDIIIFFQISFKFTKFSSNINRVKASKSFSAILTIFNIFFLFWYLKKGECSWTKVLQYSYCMYAQCVAWTEKYCKSNKSKWLFKKNLWF